MKIAQMSKVESSTTTRTLGKLEAMDLVERRADPENRRLFRIFLTEKGKDLKKQVIHLLVEVNPLASYPQIPILVRDD